MGAGKRGIQRFEDIIIQIATPYSTGTGFFVHAWNLIVTNAHVVRGNRSVVVAGKHFEKQLVSVVYLDARFDVAFLQAPLNHSMPSVSVAADGHPEEGDRVIAVGHPFDLKYTATQGIISSLTHQEEDVFYIQHDAALNPGNSGGPLIDSQGRILGINTFIIQNGNSIGFSLPSRYVVQCYLDFSAGSGRAGVRCTSCRKVTFDPEKPGMQYCANCGAEIDCISQIPDYTPLGVSQTIETVISSMGYPIALTRKGPNAWMLKKGEAECNLSYYERNGMLVGDVILCTLPDEEIEPLYTFLLERNFTLSGMMLAIQGQDVILSVIFFDQYINEEGLSGRLRDFLTQAGEMDRILIQKFNAKRRNIS